MNSFATKCGRCGRPVHELCGECPDCGLVLAVWGRVPLTSICPFCEAEVVQHEKKCRHCGESLDGESNPAVPNNPPTRDEVPDFNRKAWIAFWLYFLCYPVGLLANFSFCMETEKVRKRIGHYPPGGNALGILFWMFFVVPLWIAGIALLRSRGGFR